MSDSNLNSEDPRRFRARYIFPGNAPPIENGVVEITGDTILAIHNRPDPTATALGNVAIIPGLVNAHTHLEFSDLRNAISPPSPFTHWIQNVVAHRRQRTADVSNIVQAGLTESVQCGTSVLGEISTDDDHAARRCQSGSTMIMFREILGFDSAQAATQRDIAQAFLRTFPSEPRRVQQLVPGLSPHAPYSVHPDLFRDIVRLATEHRVPVAMHLAETTAEIELLERGTGPFVDMLQQFGVWREGVIAPRTRPLEYLRELAKTERALAVHGNYLNDEELRFLASRDNLSLVCCPRTHAYFGHAPHPWRRLLELGGRVAIGTDSRASNPDLSLWRELCSLKQRYPDVTDSQLLALGTVGGATALGLEQSAGAIAPGLPANYTVIQLNDNASLFARANSVIGVVIRGRKVK